MPALGKSVPDHQRSQRVAGPGQGRILNAHVLNGATHSFHVGTLGQHHAAGQGRADQFVPAYRNAVYAGVKPVGLRVGDERQDHAAESGVGVDVVAGNRLVTQDVPYPADVVHRAAHGGAHVGHDDGGQVAIDPDHRLQVIVVDFTVFLPPDHNVARVQHPHVFKHAVVSFFREVEHRVGEQLPRQVQAVHVAFGAAGGHVTPGIFRRDAHQSGENIDDLPFDFMGIAPEIAGVEGVTDVVD